MQINKVNKNQNKNKSRSTSRHNQIKINVNKYNYPINIINSNIKTIGFKENIKENNTKEFSDSISNEYNSSPELKKLQKENEDSEIKKFNLIFINDAIKKRERENAEILKTIVDLNSSKYKETNGVNSNQKYLPLFNRGKLKNSFLYNLHKTSNNSNNKLDKIKK